MPRTLTEADVAGFRERLAGVAERLFADKGHESVTMRQLAVELGVSPMTPYRYFKDKDDILAAVRTNGFNRLGDAMEAAYVSSAEPVERGRRIREAYLDFAFANPQTYKLMFDFNQPNAKDYPELVSAALRSREVLNRHVEAMAGNTALNGDPEQISTMVWAATHGIVVLALAGNLMPDTDPRALSAAMSRALWRGLRAE
ncbi:MAG: TetR/AcrR family transcriptional regulator [Phenylobacterium sp.]